MSTRPLDVLVVNHGAPDDLAGCLASVRRHLPGEQVRVWDNRSDASPQVRRFADGHPDVDWNFSGTGIGFAAGMNRLMARSDRDVLMLNPDAVLTGPLTRTRAALAGDRVAAASSTVVDPSGRAERWDIAHRRSSVLRSLVSHSGYGPRLRRTPLSDLYPRPPHVVDGYLTGCCLLVARAAWDDVGPFDERYFVYGEDPDWQGRARRRGWTLRMVDEGAVTHVSSQAGPDVPRSPRMGDLRAANTALVLGMRGGLGPGAFLIGGDLLLGRVQRSKRRRRALATARRTEAAGGRVPVVLTTPDLDGHGAAERVALANELAGRGHPVTVVCLDGLGAGQRELDPSVRMLLRPWWLPAVDTAGPAVLIAGGTPAEVRFAAAFAARGGGRSWVVAGPELGGPDPDRLPALLARAVHRGRARVANGGEPESYLAVA